MDDLTDEARLLEQTRQGALDRYPDAARKAYPRHPFAGLDEEAIKRVKAIEAVIDGVGEALSPEERTIISRIIARKAANAGIDPLDPVFAVDGLDYSVTASAIRRTKEMIRNSPSTIKNALFGAPGAVIRGGSALASGIASVPGAVEAGVKSFYALPRAAKLAAIRQGVFNMAAVSPPAETLLATTEASNVAIRQMLRQLFGTPLEQLPNMARTARRPLDANDPLLFIPVERRPDYVAQPERSPLGEETATGYVNPTDLYRAIIMDLAKKDYTREVEPLIVAMLGEEEGGPIGLARIIPTGIEGTQILTPDLAMQILADVLLVQDAVKKKAGAN
jgi:hypothetical protein